MKKFLLYALILSTAMLGSCKKFLEEYSQDEMRPGSTDDLASLMYSEAYPYISSMETFDMLTDDIQNNPIVLTNGSPVAAYVTALEASTPMFTFDPTMFDQTHVVADASNVYKSAYIKIKGCNVIMDYVGQVKGTTEEKNAILGQCLFLRSFYYLKLVTLYGQMYTAPGVDPEKSLGVPLVLASKVADGGIPRNTLKEVYDQIEKDLIKAEELLRSYSPSSVFRVGSDAANALLSRFYLYRGLDGDWAKSIQYATRALDRGSILTDLSTLVPSTGAITANGIYSSSNPEILWISSSQSYSDIFNLGLSGSVPPFNTSDDLLLQYNQGTGTSNYGDLRYQYYFQFMTVSGTKFAYRTGKKLLNTTPGTKGIRVAELYLNRAEAHIREFLKSGNAEDRAVAVDDLNTLRRSRYDTRNTAYVPVNITDGPSLYQFCQEERRRELALEDGHRFIDLKRWGLGVTHTYRGLDNAVKTYTLAPNSLLYALPIPYVAFDGNTSLVQNPR